MSRESQQRDDTPSWYALLKSSDLGKKPVGVIDGSQELVVWRGRTGKPVAFERYCPHHGFDLTLGSVDKNSCLRCCMHGWRFNEQGQCVHIPNTERIPPAAHRVSRTVVEWNGTVWMWGGSGPPQFDLLTTSIPHRHSDTLSGRMMRTLRWMLFLDRCARKRL
jgi:phenylpropionate dioxygenase-like ring-hydroxylating dioxygenase large terminal subunit